MLAQKVIETKKRSIVLIVEIHGLILNPKICGKKVDRKNFEIEVPMGPKFEVFKKGRCIKTLQGLSWGYWRVDKFYS